MKQQQPQQQHQASKTLCSDSTPGHAAVAGKPDSLWHHDTATEQIAQLGRVTPSPPCSAHAEGGPAI